MTNKQIGEIKTLLKVGKACIKLECSDCPYSEIWHCREKAIKEIDELLEQTQRVRKECHDCSSHSVNTSNTTDVLAYLKWYIECRISAIRDMSEPNSRRDTAFISARSAGEELQKIIDKIKKLEDGL